ncbi:uncharacterized protein METZ01_LOCUS222284 [marine metagenome]|uniref:Uncharacterized protein n=1 Tax=marine metagenome TaxID=408172 RepID=A0A382G2H1_9ZZZZ
MSAISSLVGPVNVVDPSNIAADA